MLFGEFRTDTSFNRVVEDPYYGGDEGFELNFRQLTHFSEVFVDKAVKDPASL